jgi:hypothetical protein
MSRSTRRTLSALVCAAAILFAPAMLQAVPSRLSASAPAERTTDRNVLGTLWDLLTAVWSENGSWIDPSGATVGGENGSWIDPNGVTAESDNGSWVDPNGRP